MSNTPPAQPALQGLSALAARSFASTEELTETILRLVAEQVGIRTSYLTRIIASESLLEILAAYNAPGGCGVRAGERQLLRTTYCREVAASAAPVLIPDARQAPAAERREAAAAWPNIGSYVGVPILLSDARLYGTLCAVDPEARALTGEQIGLLVVLARLLATQLERDAGLREHQRAEEALRESRERYRSLVHLSPDTIAVVGASEVRYVNPAGVRLLGASDAAEIVGRPILEFAHPDNVERVRAFVEAVGDRGEYIPPTEAQLRRVDGSAVPVEITAIPIVYQGRPAGQVIARDISRRKRAEARLAAALAEQQQINAQLERLSAAKSHFVSIVSHEFRTALTGIQGFSEMMRDEDFPIEEMKEFAADINDDAKRLSRMIGEILDLDRMESGRMALNLRPVDLNALLADQAEQLRRSSPRHPIQLELRRGLPPVAGDPDKLIQVLRNLLSNAVKYSPEGGLITVTSEQNESYARVSVRDSGLGIAQHELETVFDRYRRAESGTARYLPGTGLGLPITRQIVELHGGRVWAESAPGRGATFSFTVPWAAGAEL